MSKGELTRGEFSHTHARAGIDMHTDGGLNNKTHKYMHVHINMRLHTQKGESVEGEDGEGRVHVCVYMCVCVCKRQCGRRGELQCRVIIATIFLAKTHGHTCQTCGHQQASRRTQHSTGRQIPLLVALRQHSRREAHEQVGQRGHCEQGACGGVLCAMLAGCWPESLPSL